jgi:hypothetical protein
MDGAKPSGKDKRFFLAKQLLNVGHCIELLSLIAREAGDFEELSAQAAECVLPGPQRLEGTP